MKIRILILLLFFINSIQAKDLFWIGNSGNWNSVNHWSYTSGGISCGEIPSATDKVIFDNNSFNSDESLIHFGSISIASLSYESSYATEFIGEELMISNDFTLKNYAYFKSILKFNSSDNSFKSINTNGFSQNSDFIIEKGNWELGDHLIAGSNNTIRITCDKFNSNGYSLYGKELRVDNSRLDLTGSNIVILSNLEFNSVKKIGENPIIHSNDSLILNLGKYKGATTKDATVVCTGGLVLDLLITADYNGENISCNGACDGELTIAPSGTVGPFGYLFNNTGTFTGQTVYPNLCVGTYSITVIDSSQQVAPGIYSQCTVSDAISEPAVISFSVLFAGLPDCPGECSAAAFTNSSGGTGILVTTWDNSEITANPTGLCPGINVVTISDINGCSQVENVSISDLPPITFDVSITSPTCNGDLDAELLVSNETGGNGAGGILPWTYNFVPLPASGTTDNPAIGYGAGNVTVSVFDSTGCQMDMLVQILDPAVLTITAIDAQDVTCFGFCNGELTALPVGGVAPYSFEWFDNITGLTTGFTDSVVTTLCTGEYYVVVTDANGCVVQSSEMTIGTPSQIVASAQAYPLSCFNVCQGSVDVDAIGGTLGYTYDWTSLPLGNSIGANDSLFGLCVGQYQVIVFDANLCPSTPQVVEVLNAPELTLTLNSIDPTCYDECDGSITAVAVGGAGGFTYEWFPNPPVGQGTVSISSICADIQYDVLVTDVNDCIIQDDITLTRPPVYDVSVNTTDLLCFGDVNGTISVTVNAGGTGGPYTFNWAPGNPLGQGTNSVSGLTQGNYSVIISDGINCDTTLTFVISSPPELIANASVISDALCNSDCDGSAQVVFSGGTPVISISWDDAANQTTSPATGLCAGFYTVTVTDGNNCVTTDNVTIREPLGFIATTSQTDLDCFNGCDATATLNVISGGTPGYTINWNDPFNQIGSTATLCSGIYTATLVDQSGCDSIFEFVIANPIELTINVSVDDNACFGTCQGNASISTTGGTGVLTYEWFFDGTNAPLSVNNLNSGPLCPGDYYATVTDANGCTTTSAVFTIVELAEIESNLVSLTDVNCNASTGVAEINATGGAGGFIYTWFPAPGGGQGTTIGTGLSAGIYNVNILDVDGCEGNQSVVINSVALEVLNLDSLDVSCFGLCDGEVSVQVNCLEPPCIIEWFDNLTGLTTGQMGNSATVLCAGEYIALLTNNLGCIISDTIGVGTPPEITGVVSPIDEICFNACDGSASVVASGGEGNLFYTWNPNPGGGQSTTSAFGLCTGNWDLTISDDSLCSINIPFVINTSNEILINSITATDISCFGVDDGTTTVLASGGTGALTVEWFSCGTNNSVGNGVNLTGLTPGDYYAVITDALGCSVSSICVTVNNKNEITGIINSQNASCFGFCDAQIDVIANGGSGVYFYQWQDDAQNALIGQTNDTINNICQGNYFLEISDGNNCSTSIGPIDMTAPNTPWDVNLSSTDENCFGVCDGQAMVVVNAGNNPPYTYLWDDPDAQITNQTTNTLCGGVYNVIISDAGVCDTTVQVTIIPAAPFNLQGNQVDNLCHAECLGSATVTPTGGVLPYVITWSDGQIGNSATGLCVGDITATIEDATGCMIDTTFTITEPINSLIVNSVFNNNATCGACNGSATVNILGGTPGYTFDWTGNPNGDGTNVVTDLCAGIISVVITDANNCSISESIPISNVDAEVLTVTSTDVSCFGSIDGSADVTFVCSDPGCTQEWFNVNTGVTTGETSTHLGPVDVGDYFVQVVNASGCITIENVTIDTPSEIIPNEVITEIICAGNTDGSIILTPTGGSGAGYLYDWNPIPTNGNGLSSATGIGIGLWSVIITDGNGCTQNSDFDILGTSTLIITPTLIDVECNGADNGIISTTVTGGFGGYTYQWFMNGVIMIGETNSIVNGLAPGNYNVEVTDENGCVQTLPNDVTVSEPFAIGSTMTSTAILCNGDNDGSVTVTPIGGDLPYIINWYDGTNSLIGQTGVTASNLSAGDYYAVITDDNGCSSTTIITTISEPALLTFVLTSTDASCFGICDGDGLLVLSGGTPNYTYEWLDILGNPMPGGNLSNVNMLCQGNYTVEGTDANGCSTDIQNVVIGGFSEITANVFSNDATCGANDGNASVFVNGGNPAYTYQWQDAAQVDLIGEINSTLLNISSGTYFVSVTDASLCSETFEINISDLPSTTIVWDVVSNPSCFEGNNGEIQVTVTGASLPLSYIWNPNGEVTDDISNLSVGNYTLQVTDALGCINFYDTTIVEPDEITITPTVTNSDCDLCNGEISIVLQGGVGILTSNWNNGGTGASIDQLCPSVYEVNVTDNNGCIQSEMITVNNNSGLIANATITAISCFDECDGEISVSAFGGTLPYSYNWLNLSSTNATESNLCSGLYIIELTDSVGCISPIQINLANPSEIIISSNIIPPSCGNSDGEILILTSGGGLPHTYLWNTGDTTPGITGLSAGLYTVTVTGANGCSQDFTITLNSSTGPGIDLQAIDLNCNGDCNGEILSTITGGTPTYTQQWYDENGNPLVGETNINLINQCAGIYTIGVTDNVGCVNFGTAELIEPSAILLNTAFTDNPSCSGDCDGSIIVNPIGGVQPFNYLWNDLAAQTTITAENLCSGIYDVTITDANGCTLIQSDSLLDPLQMIIQLDSINDASCVNSNDGSISISVSNGNSTPNFQWTNSLGVDISITEDLLNVLPMDYYLTVTDDGGCMVLDTFTVDTTLVVFAFAGNDTLICFDTDILLIGESNQPNADFTWFDINAVEVSDTNELNIFNQLPGIEGYVLVADYLGCSYSDTIMVITQGQILANAGPDIELLTNETEAIGGDPTSNINTTLIWTPSIYLDDTLATNPNVINPEEDTWYIVTVTDTNGCSEFDSVFVEAVPVLVIPDGISPNGDGKNDTWQLQFVEDFPNLEVSVYNRWGELLFYDYNSYPVPWDGKFNGEELPVGSYYYVINLHDELYPEPFTGPLTIMR
jgi:gliding motility-associated-like protein